MLARVLLALRCAVVCINKRPRDRDTDLVCNVILSIVFPFDIAAMT